MPEVWECVKEWLLPNLPYPKSKRGVCMRKRTLIEADGKRKEDLLIEVALDIRDLLVKATKTKRKPRKGKEE